MSIPRSVECEYRFNDFRQKCHSGVILRSVWSTRIIGCGNYEVCELKKLQPFTLSEVLRLERKSVIVSYSFYHSKMSIVTDMWQSNITLNPCMTIMQKIVLNINKVVLLHPQLYRAEAMILWLLTEVTFWRAKKRNVITKRIYATEEYFVTTPSNLSLNWLHQTQILVARSAPP